MVKENSMDSVRISGAFYFTGQKWPKFCTAAVSLDPRDSDAPSAKSREKRAHRDAHQQGEEKGGGVGVWGTSVVMESLSDFDAILDLRQAIAREGERDREGFLA